MPIRGYKAITQDEASYRELQELAKNLGMKSVPELIRAVLRKKERIEGILYTLRFFYSQKAFMGLRARRVSAT